MLRPIAWLSISVSSLTLACSGSSAGPTDIGSSGGTATQSGGATTGGATTGGAATGQGGSSKGGNATQSGGTTTGGAAQSGGSSNQGGSNSQGGAAIQGGSNSTGGAISQGGTAVGGSGQGGSATGGKAAGGVTTGASSAGGASVGGAAKGGAVATGGAGNNGGCDAGTTTTAWATNCPTAPPTTCTSGTWNAGGPDPDHSGFKLCSESTHFAVYSDETCTATAQTAVTYLETVWNTYFGSPIYMREPLCNSATKYKASVHVHSDWGLTGGSWATGRMGMWIGTGGLADHWGLAHEFMHGVQSVQGGQACNQSNTCGWVYESHANFMPHQMAEYANDVHCSVLSADTPHMYLGSTRVRYCNWQFMEYLKDKYCYSAVNAIWTGTPVNNPFQAIMNGMSWSITQLNDFFGDWAMHNVTWDYKVSGAAMRSNYGAITDKSKQERRLRLTQLEPLDSSWATNRRFQSPYFWAPQRWGYNVTRLYPESGATSVTVSFRGVTQSGANSEWRWGLVAVNGTTPRYSALQKGTDGELNFCVGASDAVYLVVTATPSAYQSIIWDQAYSTIYRYPYMVQVAGAWPEGYQGGALAACPSGTVRITNGGGCGPSSLNSTSSVYVGPYALVTGGTISGNARIEDHAQVLGGTVSGGTVGALTIFNSFTVSGTAKAQTTYYPLNFFEGRSISGSAVLYGDVELRADRSSGTCSGFVDGSTCTAPGTEVTTAPPYTWR